MQQGLQIWGLHKRDLLPPLPQMLKLPPLIDFKPLGSYIGPLSYVVTDESNPYMKLQWINLIPLIDAILRLSWKHISTIKRWIESSYNITGDRAKVK